MTAIDVGHGDALAIRTPEGAQLLVDTGGSWHGTHANDALAGQSVLPTLARLGFDRVDVLVISHAHPDHLGAALAVARRLPIGELWVPPCGLDHPKLQRLAALVRSAGGAVRVVARAPPFELGGARAEILWPPEDATRPDGACRYGLNDASVVLRLDYAGRSILLTGDIEAPAEAALVQAGAALAADVLKVPHHGSKTSSTPAFVAAVSPKVAVVSGAPFRRRMPPHGEVIARYRAQGVPVWVTGSEGAVTVRVAEDGGVWIDSRGDQALVRPP